MIDFTWSDKKLESPKIKHDCFDFVLKKIELTRVNSTNPWP
jgi:hypothetical protein